MGEERHTRRMSTVVEQARAARDAGAAWRARDLLAAHVEAQRAIYRQRLELGRQVLARLGVEAPMPGGGFYLWAPAPGGDAWALAERLARQAGALVSPGEFYGAAGTGHVRVAMVQPDDQLHRVAERVGL